MVEVVKISGGKVVSRTTLRSTAIKTAVCHEGAKEGGRSHQKSDTLTIQKPIASDVLHRMRGNRRR